MPFKRKDMHAFVKGPSTIWTYRTDDTANKVFNRGYFEDFGKNLAVGDWIMATTSTGGIILHVDEIDPLEIGRPR